MATGLIQQGQRQPFKSEGFSAEGFSTGAPVEEIAVQQFDPDPEKEFLEGMRSLGQARWKAGPVIPDVLSPMELMYRREHRTKGGELDWVDFSTSEDERLKRWRQQYPNREYRETAGLAWPYTDEPGVQQIDTPIVKLNTYHEGDAVNLFRHEGPGHVVLSALDHMDALEKIPFAEEMSGMLRDSVRAMELAGYTRNMIQGWLGDNIKFKDGQWWTKGNLTLKDFYDIMQMDPVDRMVMPGRSDLLGGGHGLVSAMQRDPTLMENILDERSSYLVEPGKHRITGEELWTDPLTGAETPPMLGTTEAREELIMEPEFDVQSSYEVPVTYRKENQAALGENARYDPITYALVQGRYADRAIEKINQYIQKNIFGKEGWLEELTWYEDNVAARARGE